MYSTIPASCVVAGEIFSTVERPDHLFTARHDAHSVGDRVFIAVSSRYHDGELELSETTHVYRDESMIHAGELRDGQSFVLDGRWEYQDIQVERRPDSVTVYDSFDQPVSLPNTTAVTLF